MRSMLKRGRNKREWSASENLKSKRKYKNRLEQEAEQTDSLTPKCDALSRGALLSLRHGKGKQIVDDQPHQVLKDENMVLIYYNTPSAIFSIFWCGKCRFEAVQSVLLALERFLPPVPNIFMPSIHIVYPFVLPSPIPSLKKPISRGIARYYRVRSLSYFFCLDIIFTEIR